MTTPTTTCEECNCQGQDGVEIYNHECEDCAKQIDEKAKKEAKLQPPNNWAI